MTFRAFMIKNHIKDDTPVGDLARDMKTVKDFPRVSQKNKQAKNKIVMYLELKRACSGALDAFNEAWKLFKDFKEE